MVNMLRNENVSLIQMLIDLSFNIIRMNLRYGQFLEIDVGIKIEIYFYFLDLVERNIE